MGSSQSNAVFTSELTVAGIVLLAGAYFFTSKPRSSTQTAAIHGKHSTKNRRKRDNCRGTQTPEPT